MKGVVFTEFIEFVEKKFGFDTVDVMIENSGLSGVYTQAGNYPFEEMVALVTALSQESGVGVSELIESYGKHLFGLLISIYPHVDRFSSAFDIIAHVDNIIHPEVKKLYPDADLPSFTIKEQTPERILLQYLSNKGLQDLAKGLMIGAGEYYKEDISVTVFADRRPIEIEVRKNNG
ncbi:MAG: heme NO-binding domain-containing protein [Sulfurimonas sp.]